MRPEQRKKLMSDIAELARKAIFGTASETYRTCGNAGCRCHGAGPKHGPHMYVSYRSAEGKTTGYYVPTAAQPAVRDGVLAWQQLQQRLRNLADDTRDQVISAARADRARRSANPKRRG
jgi:hypothetical protein